MGDHEFNFGHIELASERKNCFFLFFLLSHQYFRPPNMGGGRFPTPGNSLVLSRHQLGVLQLSQFWHCTPAVSIRSHRLRAESHKAAPLHYCRCQSQAVGPQVTHNLCCKLGGSHDPLFGFDNFLEWLTELRETVYLLDYLFIIKWYNSGTARWNRARYVGRGAELPCPLWACQHLCVFINQGDLWTPTFLDFYGGFVPP